MAFQRSRIFRGDVLGLHVSTDEGSDKINTLSQRLRDEALPLFSEHNSKFGMPLMGRTGIDLHKDVKIGTSFSSSSSSLLHPEETDRMPLIAISQGNILYPYAHFFLNVQVTSSRILFLLEILDRLFPILLLMESPTI